MTLTGTMTLTDFDSIAAGNADEKKEETVAMRSMQTYRNEERLHTYYYVYGFVHCELPFRTSHFPCEISDYLLR